MALSDDQKAILRLLSQRGEQGYADLSALMGVDAAEVHRRAKEAAAEQGSRKVTKALLEPVDGSDAIGIAIFGRVKKSLALQVAAEGLEPTDKGESYTIWLAASPQKMLPLASTNEVGDNGRLAAQVEAPVEVLAYLADETFGQIAITRTEDSRLESTLREATKKKQAPAYTGEEVLVGNVEGPIVGAAKRLEEQRKSNSK